MKLCRIHETVSVQEKPFGDGSKRDLQMETEAKETMELCNIENRTKFGRKYYDDQYETEEPDRYECNRCASKSHKSDDAKCPDSDR